MDVFEEYTYVCIACHEPLLAGTYNRWARVGRRHLMPRTGTTIRELDQLLLEDDSVSGKQELALCELQRLQCGNCKSQVGLKCKDAPTSKTRLIGRLFVRQDAMEVHGLTSPPSSSFSSRMRVVQRLQFVVESQPLPHSPDVPVGSSASSTVESNPHISNPPASVKTISADQVRAILDDHARLIAEVKALREVAAKNQHFIRTQLDQESSMKSSADEHQNDVSDASRMTPSTKHSKAGSDESAGRSGEPMIIDSHGKAVESAGAPPTGESRYETQLSAPPIDLPPARYSDSEYEPTQPMIDQPLHQPVTRNLARGEAHRKDTRNVSPDLRRNTLEDLHKSQDVTRHTGGPTHRGGALRRGVSGGRGRAVATTPQRKRQELNAAPLRDENGNLITSTGKIDGRSLRYKNKRAAEYRSSPLAAPFPIDGMALSDSTTPAQSDATSNGNSKALAGVSGMRKASSSSEDGVARGHQEIMKFVNKGMRAQMAKSRLERGYARLPRPN